MSKHRKEVGLQGEMIARDYLESCGWRIIATNYRCRFGEIDIIAEDNGTLVFVEVRTRTSLKCGAPEESITASKRMRLIKLASIYLSRLGREVPCRFDIVTLLIGSGKNDLRHFVSAF